MSTIMWWGSLGSATLGSRRVISPLSGTGFMSRREEGIEGGREGGRVGERDRRKKRDVPVRSLLRTAANKKGRDRGRARKRV
jgi:hypothetical protein